MKTAQLYAVIASEENAKFARPAQFVFAENHTNEVSGFIVDVNEYRMTLCLFEPVPVKEYMVDILAEDGVDWPKLLADAIAKNPEMKWEWAEALGFTSREELAEEIKNEQFTRTIH